MEGFPSGKKFLEGLNLNTALHKQKRPMRVEMQLIYKLELNFRSIEIGVNIIDPLESWYFNSGQNWTLIRYQTRTSLQSSKSFESYTERHLAWPLKNTPRDRPLSEV